MSTTPIVLIVDDTLAGRETLRALLASGRYQLEYATNGPEALAAAAQLVPDLILLDVMMPGMDGFEVCRRLRADRTVAEVPIIMVTALDDRESRLQGLDAGADDFISKPFDRAELRARVQTITRLNRYRKLLTERASFEWVVEQAKEGYLIVDMDDTLLYANEQARLLLNPIAPATLSGQFLPLASQYFQCEPDTAWVGWPHQSPADLARAHYLVRPESAAAHAQWLAVSCLDLPSDGQARRLIRLHDVTTQMTTRREMWTFHAMIAHKLRTPLVGLVMGVDLLANNSAQLDADEIAGAAHSASHSAHRLSNAINDIIRFMEAPALARLSHRFALAHLAALIEAIRSDLQLRTVAIEFDPAVSAAALLLSVNAVELIMRELLENARKFHPRQQPQILVTVRQLDAQRALLRVIDDGRTLPAEELARVWTPYFQGEKDFTGQLAGMGLGLAMVASLVWEAGGACRLFNRHDGPGVVVELILPLSNG